MKFVSSSKNVGKRDTGAVLVDRRRGPQTTFVICRADLNNLDLVVGVCSTLQRTTRCCLGATEILEAGNTDRIEVQFLGVTAACQEIGSVANGSACFEQVAGILVELELSCQGGRTDEAGDARLAAADSDVLTIADSDVERSSQGGGGAGGRSSA